MVRTIIKKKGSDAKVEKPELEKVVYRGEEYYVVPINPMTGYRLERLDGASEETKQELEEYVEEVIGRGLYHRMINLGALERMDTVEGKVAFIECRALVLVKHLRLAEENHEDPEQSRHTHGT